MLLIFSTQKLIKCEIGFSPALYRKIEMLMASFYKIDENDLYCLPIVSWLFSPLVRLFCFLNTKHSLTMACFQQFMIINSWCFCFKNILLEIYPGANLQLGRVLKWDKIWICWWWNCLIKGLMCPQLFKYIEKWTSV